MGVVYVKLLIASILIVPADANIKAAPANRGVDAIIAISPYWKAASSTSICLTAPTIPMLTIPIKHTKSVKSKTSPVTMAPAVASPHMIARKRLNLNSFLATVNCLITECSEFSFNLGFCFTDCNYEGKCKCCREHEEVKGGHVEYNVS